MKYFTILAVTFLIASSSAIKLRDDADDDEPMTASQKMGMRDGDMLEEQCNDFMAQARETMSKSGDRSRKKALERAKANSPTGSIHIMSKPEPIDLAKEDKLPEI